VLTYTVQLCGDVFKVIPRRNTDLCKGRLTKMAVWCEARCNNKPRWKKIVDKILTKYDRHI